MSAVAVAVDDGNHSILQEKNDFKVIILGAGMAGLSAANHLIKNNIHDFVILEARNRIGGRIVAVNIGGRRMELGANWIHGVLGNPIYELAVANGLVQIIQENKPHNVISALPSGKKVPFHILQEIYDAYSCFFKRCEEYFLCKYMPPEAIQSVGDHILLEIDIYLGQYSEQERIVRRAIFQYLLNRETCISGCNDMNEVDLMEIGSYTELPGGNIVLPGGYSSILGPMTRDIPPERIVKGCNVTHVRWNMEEAHSVDAGCDILMTAEKRGDRTAEAGSATEKCISNNTNYKNSGVEVECENGIRVYADHVICTLPLGVIKERWKTMFHPPLPPYKVNSMALLGFGTVNKIYLEYERPFLAPELDEVICLWDPTVLPGEVMEDRWFRKIYSFAKVTDTLLMGWVSGEEGRFLESLPFDAVADKCTEILRQFLDDPYVPKPKRCICTSWWSQPFTRGSYTSIGVGGSQIDVANMAHPLYARSDSCKPSVLFAGEHCHPSFYSTVHGAYLTGREAAQLLCNVPDTPQEEVLTVEGTADLASWIRGISLS